MPIQTTIYHPDRLIIGRGTGALTFQEFVDFGRRIEAEGLVHYRKILDVIQEICAIVPGPVSAEVVALDHDGMMREAEILRKIADNVCIPLYFLARLVRQSGTTVVQVGEGADENFLGYWWWVLGPGLALVITSVTFMLLAIALEPVVNPRLRGGDGAIHRFGARPRPRIHIGEQSPKRRFFLREASAERVARGFGAGLDGGSDDAAAGSRKPWSHSGHSAACPSRSGTGVPASSNPFVYAQVLPPPP